MLYDLYHYLTRVPLSWTTSDAINTGIMRFIIVCKTEGENIHAQESSPHGPFDP